jgi:hypothetical protein
VCTGARDEQQQQLEAVPQCRLEGVRKLDRAPLYGSTFKCRIPELFGCVLVDVVYMNGDKEV